MNSRKITLINGELFTLKYDWGDAFITTPVADVGLNSFGLPYAIKYGFEVTISNSFIRGVGKTVMLAEEDAFNILKKYNNCDHDFQRTSKSGNAKCSKCEKKVKRELKNLNKCIMCNTSAEFTILKNFDTKTEHKVCLEHFQYHQIEFQRDMKNYESKSAGE